MLSSYRDHLEPIPGVFRLKPQEDVEIEFRTAEADLVRFKSRVSNVTAKGVSFELDRAGITAPELTPGRTAFIALIREDALYGFEAEILRLTKYPLLVVENPKKFFRIQRREYFRLRVSLPVRYAVLDRQGQSGPLRDGHIVELSAHGLRMRVKEEISPDTALELHFSIPLPPVKVAVAGSVLRVSEREDQLQLIAFYPGIPEKTRDSIMQYLMTEQRALLRGDRVR